MSELNKKIIMCDPPGGWKYGFPKAIPAQCLTDDFYFKFILISNGYPNNSQELELALKHSRFWEEDPED